MDSIYALSSGSPPAAIAIMRVSGPLAGQALLQLAGELPEPRRLKFAALRDRAGEILDHAVVVWLPGPATVTGEDLAELHLHGGRAVVAAVDSALSKIAGLRRALPGEFTRRAFINGKIDLAEAEGLADLLSAETELHRKSAMLMAGGALSRQIETWRENVLGLSAAVEAALDFSDEDDVSTLPPEFLSQVTDFKEELDSWLLMPRADKLRDGIRVVLAGPPNAGKSTLFNALLSDDAAITAATAGTTRDVLERPVSLAGVPFTFVDTAGLRDASDDAVEAIGIERAKEQAQLADVVLWLGAEGEGPAGAWEVDAKCDEDGHQPKRTAVVSVSAVSGEGVSDLIDALVEHARGLLPAPRSAALNARQHGLIEDAASALSDIDGQDDPLVIAEQLRFVRLAFDRLIGRTSTEDMLDALFGRFCIGK